MIRFVWLGAQINEGGEEFAFYDTVADRFMSFGGEQVFDSLYDFKYCCTDKVMQERCVGLVRANHPTRYPMTGGEG
jgi:hypothetical protein